MCEVYKPNYVARCKSLARKDRTIFVSVGCDVSARSAGAREAVCIAPSARQSSHFGTMGHIAGRGAKKLPCHQERQCKATPSSYSALRQIKLGKHVKCQTARSHWFASCLPSLALEPAGKVFSTSCIIFPTCSELDRTLGRPRVPGPSEGCPGRWAAWRR